MKQDKSEILIELTQDRGLYHTKAEWESYDIELDIDSAVAMLVLVAHQFIDTQKESVQIEFETTLLERFKDDMKVRHGSIEPLY